MTKRLLLLSGLLALLPFTQTASAETLYERIKSSVEREVGAKDIDDEVADFIAKLYEEKWELAREDVHTIMRGNASVVCGDKALDEPGKTLIECQQMASDVTRLAGYEETVRSAGRSLQAIATGYELPIADLPGRSLKLSSDLRGIMSIWSAGTGSIKTSSSGGLIRFIAADPDKFGPLLEKVGDELKKLTPEEMTAAVWRYQYGMRLQSGYRTPAFQEFKEYGEGDWQGEERYLVHNWDDLSMALYDMWASALSIEPSVSPALSKGEVAYIVLPEDLRKKFLPDNVIVWLQIGEGGYTLASNTAADAFGDAGLQWETPLEPVLPSLLNDDKDPILGGNYPNEPVFIDGEEKEPADGRGLCTSPTALRGYLCRPYILSEPDQRCPVPGDLPEDQISLVYCEQGKQDPEDNGVWCCNGAKNQCSQVETSLDCVEDGGSPSATMDGCAANGCPVPPVNPVLCCLKNQGRQCIETINSGECVRRGGAPSADAKACIANGCEAPEADFQRYSEAGPNVCRDINWKLPEPFDPDTQCRLKLACEPDCEIDGVATAQLKRKNDAGLISICMQEESQDIQTTYLLYHEMVHAYQFCSLPVGTWYKAPEDDASEEEKREILEWNSALCCRIEGEGYRAMCDLMERDGVFDGMGSVNGIPLNAETCAEFSTDWSCGPRDGFNGCYTSYEYNEDFKDKLFEAVQKNPKNLPSTCSAAIDPDLMDPRVKEFKESIERRVDICAPGEQTNYVNLIGNNLCFIGQCVEQATELHRLTPGRTTAGVADEVAPWDDRLTGSPLGNLVMNPSLSQGALPPYRPQLLLREAEIALCQLQGLPPMTPPVLCLADSNRQLEQPAELAMQVAFNLIRQRTEQQLSTTDFLNLSPALGSRKGTELYADYMRDASRSFAGVLDIAAQMMEEIKEMEFPTEMCPVGPGLPSAE